MADDLRSAHGNWPIEAIGAAASIRNQVRKPRGLSAAGLKDKFYPVDAICHQFNEVFGNLNQDQVFALMWPGTVLDPLSYKNQNFGHASGVKPRLDAHRF